MAAGALHLELVTPKQRYLSEQVDMAVVPGELGDLGIMAHHAPLVSMLRPGMITVHLGSQKVQRYFVGGGYVNVANNICTVLAESLTPAESLEREAIMQELNRLRAERDLAKSDINRAALDRAILEAETKHMLAR